MRSTATTLSKIALVSTSRWPSELADTRLMAKMAENFSLFGHPVTYLVPDRGQTNSSLLNKSAWGFYGIKPNQFKVKKLLCLDWLSLHPIGLWNILLTSSFLISTISFVKNKPPEIVYTFQKEFFLIKLLFPHSKFALEFHDIPSDRYQQLLFYLVKRKVDLWITPTRELANYLIKSSVSPKKIISTPAGVDLDKYNKLTQLQARKKLAIPKDKKIIGYIGSLRGKDGSRGLDTVIKALTHLPGKVIFVCVGGNASEIKPLTTLAKKLKVGHRCQFIPQTNHSQVPVYLASFNTCLLPFPNKSHYRHYMSPMKMVEYMAAHRPIVTTDLPSIREILDESSAIFVKPGNPKDLAQGIRRSLDPTTTKLLTKKSYKIGKSFTWTNRAKLINSKLQL